MFEILNTIGMLIILALLGLGFYCGVAYCFAFGILLFDGKFLKFAEWSVNNKWCFPTYYLSVLAIGIIASVLQVDDKGNLSKR
jgi:hypothetical protein